MEKIMKFHSLDFRLIFMYVFILLIFQNQQIRSTPTIYPAKEFNALEDAKTLQHLGRLEQNYVQDDDKIADIICHRSREQRIAIKEEFAKLPNIIHKDVVGHIQSDGEMSYNQLIEDCFKTEMEIYLHDFHREIESPWKRLDKDTVVEILLSIPPSEKKNFIDMYAKEHGPIEEAVDTHLNGDFKNVVLEMIKRERQPDIPVEAVNIEVAKTDAKKLNDEIDKWGDCRQELDRILNETPFLQLNATLTEFRNIHGKELDEVIHHKMKKNKGKRGAYKSMIFFVKNRLDYFARRLEHAMSGWGTEDHTLNRIVSIQCEKDLTEIAVAFKLNTADELIKKVESDVIIHHEQLLACLMGKQEERKHCR